MTEHTHTYTHTHTHTHTHPVYTADYVYISIPKGCRVDTLLNQNGIVTKIDHM